MTATQSLYQLLDENTSRLDEHLFHPNFSGDDHSFLRKKKRVILGSGPCIDEALWTFLVACGYAMAGTHGIARLTKILTGTELSHSNDITIWLEPRPIPPRKLEGNTHLDLAVGSIARRGTTKSGVELDNHFEPWICFCEMKWNSDISESVEHDAGRNQLARVIENALCFHKSGRYADSAYVALVTPAVFREQRSERRFYQSKFREYVADYANILNDLNSGLPKRDHYPASIKERLKTLTLRWITFDDMFSSIPDSPISEALKTFWKERSEYA